MRTISRRLLRRHGTAVAYLALFAALGGSAYAAVTVTGKNIRDGTVTGRDVKDRSLGTKELSATALGSLAGQSGPAGPQGPKGEAGERGSAGPTGETGPMGPRGPQGPQGPQGWNGVSGWEYRVSSPGRYVPAHEGGAAHVDCAAAKKALGGGMARVGGFWTYVTQSSPRGEATGWDVEVWNDSPVGATIYAWVICASVQ